LPYISDKKLKGIMIKNDVIGRIDNKIRMVALGIPKWEK